MSQRDYGSKNLKWQILIKIIFIFILLLLLARYLNNSILLKLFSDDVNIIQLIIIVVLTIFIICTLILGKIDGISSKVYYSILIFVYINFILYLFILFLNILYNYNNVSIRLFPNMNLSKFLIILTVIIALLFSILEGAKYSSTNNIIVDLVVKDNRNKSKKFNLFLDTCINFIIMFAILSFFLKF